MAPVKSLTTIANNNSWGELLSMMKSFDFWNKAEIYVFCDKIVGEKLSKIMLGQCPIHIHPLMPDHLTKANRGNLFGELLRCKMDAIEISLKEMGQTLFVDADMIFLNEARGIDLDHYDIVLSQHFIRESDEKKWGRYNAGYVGTRTAAFTKWWRKACDTSKYVDQECLVHAPAHFNCQMLGLNHNFGWWRVLQSSSKEENERRIASFHVNGPTIYFGADPLISVHSHIGIKSRFNAMIKDLLLHSTDSRHKDVASLFRY